MMPTTINNKNLIVLTTGSSGSSVLTGLIAKQGFWLGEKTKKLNFDTYENAELVDLNIKILELSGFKRRDCNDMPAPSIERISELINEVDPTPFLKFLKKCKKNQPWLWKDPRLAYTIHFWAQFKDIKNADYLFIDRDPKQSYAGLILSRKVPMSYQEQIIMNQNYKKSCDSCLEKYGLSIYRCLFEDLILEPEEFIQNLNNEFGFNISIHDLTEVYKGNLYTKRYNRWSLLKAKIQYLLYKHIKKDYIRFPRS